MGKEIIQDRSIDLTDVGGIKFSEAEHTYHNADGVRYTGITTLLGNYHEHFDDVRVATNKAIKDCVIDFFGSDKYNEILGKPNGLSLVDMEARRLPAYSKDAVLNQSIKTCLLESVGEEKYMLLEKQVAGYDNLHSSIKRFQKAKPDLFKQIVSDYTKRAAILNLGNQNYKELKSEYGGFDNILNGLDEIRMLEPSLHKLIMDKKEYLLNDWKEINLRAVTEGTIEHDKREQDIYDAGGYEFEGVWYEYIEGKNIANVTIDDVIVIPECMVWNHDMKLGGLADIFLFNKGIIYVLDYKTNASIDITTQFEKHMTGPCSSLLDLNYYHYSLQLKIYQRMAIMIQPTFTSGKNVIIHTTSDTHYRYVDKLFDCHEVNDIVTNIFKELGCES